MVFAGRHEELGPWHGFDQALCAGNGVPIADHREKRHLNPAQRVFVDLREVLEEAPTTRTECLQIVVETSSKPAPTTTAPVR